MIIVFLSFAMYFFKEEIGHKDKHFLAKCQILRPNILFFNIVLPSLVEAVVKNNQIDATVDKVDDIMEVMQYNVMSLPALVVDGQVLARGQKSEKELLEILK